LNPDFLDFLRCLIEAGARFLVVGAHAMAVHGVPRATGDIDIWVGSDPDNAGRVWEAVLRFGVPAADLGVSRADLETPDKVIQIGVPPRRIDLLTSVSGLVFESAWTNRTTYSTDGVDVPFLSRADLVRNKRASGRPKDLVDLDELGGPV
jgi:hypothetical protein